MITKTAKVDNNWERVGLTEEELNEAMVKLLEHNMNELDRISKHIIDKKIEDSNKEIVFKALAEKQLTSNFTVLVNALDEKLFRLRNKQNKPIPKKQEQTIKKQVEDGFKKKDLPEGESAIDKAFNETSMSNE